MESFLKSRKIAFVIAFRDFRDEEYFIPKEILEKAGAKIITFSSSLGTAIGKLGGETEVERELENLDVSNYNAILFAGGPGAVKYFEDEKALLVCRQAVEQDKVLGAICIAPVILAKAGVLKGKKATVWNSAIDKSAIKILKKEGAIFNADNQVVKDGNIITASGPLAAQEFALAIVEMLK